MATTLFPVLQTKRCILREIALGDSAFWLRNFSDPVTVDLTAYAAPADESAAKREIEEFCSRPFQRGDGIRWGIAFRRGGDLVGTVGFHGWAKNDRRARVGYDLLPEHRGRGVMTESMKAVIGYGFQSMNLNKIEAHLDPRNVKSLNLLARLGFVLEGMLREQTFFRGSYRDEAVYSLLSREWSI